MKFRYNKICSALIAALAIASSFALQSCEDEPDKFELTGGKPTIYYIRPADVNASDSLLVQAYPQAQICIVGENLTSIQQMYFNDQKAILNTSFITEKTLVVQIPSDIPDEVSDKIYMITKDKDTLTYDFHIVVPAPVVASMSCEFAKPGTTATIYGSYFVDDPNVPIVVTFPDGTVISNFTTKTRSVLSFEVPNCTTEGTISVTSIYGTGTSSFHYLDSRGLLFDFDTPNVKTGAVLGNHGWHAQVIETDETALSGNFLRLGGTSVTLDADGSWNDGNFSFEYWPGNWADPETYSGDGVRLTDLADFSDYSNMAYKFEMYVPSANPWSAGAMQVIVGGVTKISMGSAGVSDIYGNVLAGCNNSYFNNDELPRALYRPWESTGSYDTGDEWVTVTIPMSDFKYGMSGSAATGSLSASDFTSLTLFVVGGGITGTECNPVIKIDNIRAVPNK